MRMSKEKIRIKLVPESSDDMEMIRLLNNYIGIIHLDGSFYCFEKTLKKTLFGVNRRGKRYIKSVFKDYTPQIDRMFPLL